MGAFWGVDFLRLSLWDVGLSEPCVGVGPGPDRSSLTQVCAFTSSFCWSQAAGSGFGFGQYLPLLSQITIIRCLFRHVEIGLDAREHAFGHLVEG